MSALELRGVCKRYGLAAALEDVSLVVPDGSRTAIVGPSGSGKTTLLRVVAGFEAPDRGSVLLGGEVVADGAVAVPAHRRGVGVVAQDGALFPHLSVGENVGFGLARDEVRRNVRIAELMELVGLPPGMLSRRPDELSGGQQQRVALARALARRPRLMLLDEPFSALDTALRASTRQAVAALLGQAGVTTVLVTHDQAEALSFADQVAVMQGARLLQVGTPREVYRRPIDRAVAEFLGDAIVMEAEVSGGIAECALGRVAVPAGAAAGRTTIMLRPEQVVLEAAAAGEAVVEAVDFGGAVSAFTLRLSTGEALTVRQGSADLLVPGVRVRVRLVGEAHVFGVRG